MSQFITLTDYDASIHREILDSLVRAESPTYDPNIIEVCEDRAVAEMRSHMADTYDTEAIFSATGDNRHQLILMFAIDIAIYHIFCLHNPYKISKVREERYKRAIEWLKGIKTGEISIDGAPRLPEDEQADNSPWQIQAEDVRPVFM